MAMNGNTMGTAVKDAIKAEMASQGLAIWNASQEADADKFWKTICTTIVSHITTNAEVSTNVSTSVASGIACSVDPGTHIGSTTGTGTGTETGAAGTIT